MEISSKHVGMKCRPFFVDVTPQRTMNYAAGTQDANPHYFDDVHTEGLLAPPLLAQALTWPASSDLEQHWELGDFPAELMARKVHFTEVLEWAQPLLPGQRLRIEGHIAAIIPQRGGTLLTLCYYAYDAANALVFTEHAGALLRDVACPDGGAGADTLPAMPHRVSSKAPALWDTRITVDPVAAHVYEACSGIHFPIHSSRAFAQSVGLPNILYHGAATLTLAAREIINREADGDARRLKMIRCQFTGMVFPGSDITVHATGGEVLDGVKYVYFTVFNQEEQRAIHKGIAAIV